MTTTDEMVDIELGTAVNIQPIPDGFYPATLLNLEVVDNKFEPGRKQVKLSWGIESGPAKGRTLTSWANLGELTQKSKLRQISEALLGRTLQPGESPRSGELIGREARLTVEQTHKTDGTLISRVIKVKPLRPTVRAVEDDDGDIPL